MAIVHDIAEAIVGDITPSDGFLVEALELSRSQNFGWSMRTMLR
ncbi:BnaA07g37060D [Brassica napus]|uniref:(rape) hypothetical protein n=1 Tax=Brassica napus TaxID=3708 RepID=A0A078IPU7_BRANA|nr:unnamed protein product [Brassica napus]CDY51123.1 BnaA07g37060D [Brassica napus]